MEVRKYNTLLGLGNPVAMQLQFFPDQYLGSTVSTASEVGKEECKKRVAVLGRWMGQERAGQVKANSLSDAGHYKRTYYGAGGSRSRGRERRADWGTDHNKADGEGPLQQCAVLTRGWAAMVAGKGRSEKVRTGRAKQRKTKEWRVRTSAATRS
jgi:hypothetical protein